jgi:DNA-binding IclR family transcriptional regulator
MAAEHRTVSRVLGILEAVARAHDPVTLTELSRALDAPKSSLHGLVSGLLQRGYLREADGGYRMGAGAHALLQPAGTSLPLLLGPTCEEIALRTGETATVAVRVGAESVVYVHTSPSLFEVCYRPRMRERRPLLPTSSGKLFLAHDADDGRAAVLARAGERERSVFEREASAILETGMAFNREETVADLGAVAVGVHEAGELTACLTIAGPHGRVADRLEEFGRLGLDVLRADGCGRDSGESRPKRSVRGSRYPTGEAAGSRAAGSVVRQAQGEEHAVLIRARVVPDAGALEAQRGVEGDGAGVVRQRGRLDHVLLIGLRTGDECLVQAAADAQVTVVLARGHEVDVGRALLGEGAQQIAHDLVLVPGHQTAGGELAEPVRLVVAAEVALTPEALLRVEDLLAQLQGIEFVERADDQLVRREVLVRGHGLSSHVT